MLKLGLKLFFWLVVCLFKWQQTESGANFRRGTANATVSAGQTFVKAARGTPPVARFLFKYRRYWFAAIILSFVGFWSFYFISAFCPILFVPIGLAIMFIFRRRIAKALEITVPAAVSPAITTTLPGTIAKPARVDISNVLPPPTAKSYETLDSRDS